MKKLEMIELEPYKAPALTDITPVSIVQVIGSTMDPDTPGGDNPLPDPSDPGWNEED